MNGGRLVEEEPWLPEQITRRSRLLLPFALVARLEVFAQPSELADLLPSRRAPPKTNIFAATKPNPLCAAR